MKYTTTFKKAVLRKVLPPENRSVHSVSMEPGVGEMTIHRWIAQVLKLNILKILRIFPIFRRFRPLQSSFSN